MARRIDHDDAHSYSATVLEAAGYSSPSAEKIAEQLTGASLRGVDTHGVAALLAFHVSEALIGRVDLEAKPTIEGKGSTCFVVEGHGAPGPDVHAFAYETAAQEVRKSGMAAVAVRNSGYLGDLSYFVTPWAEQGYIAMMMANAEAEVAPHLGAEALHGTNPIAFAFPTESDPIVIDMRTNAMRRADYWEAVRTASPLSEGMAITSDGQPVTRPDELDNGVLLPLAGAKGFALALAVDLFTAGLAGGPIGTELGPESAGAYSSFTLVLDPEAFRDDRGFVVSAGLLASQVKAMQPIDPADPVRLPGEASSNCARSRRANGIPIDWRWSEMVEDLARLGIDVPLPALREDGESK